MGGLTPGKMIIIGARPGMAKSAFSNQLLFDTLELNQGKKLMGLYWSWEMPGEDQISRLGANRTQRELYDLFSIDTTLSDEHFMEYSKAVSNYRKYPIYFCEQPQSAGTIALVNQRVAESQPDWQVINVVDHTRLVEGGRGEQDELASINRLSKTIFTQNRKYKTIDIILSQLNRKIEGEGRAKGGYKPVSSDLFGADSLSQDADLIVMLNRPYDVYGLPEKYEGHDPRGLLAAHVVKNRGGRIGMIPFDFDAKHFSITERNDLINLSSHAKKQKKIINDEIF